MGSQVDRRFAKRTFEDLQKLNELEPGEWGMFLAVNIGDKYERARRGITSTRDATTFFKEGKTETVLEKKWDKAKATDLLKCNPRFWRRRYDKKCDLTVLTCFGKRTHNGWVADAGCTEVLMPKENERDVQMTPEYVKNKIKVRFISSIDEVLSAALLEYSTAK